jgi:membrane protein implicated in regulation of membrane protease activity
MALPLLADLAARLSTARPSFWFVLGLLLVLSEFAVPGVMICFFGFAALLVAGLLLVWPTAPTSVVLAAYIVLSLALLFGLRRYMPKTFRGHAKAAESDPDEDDVAGSRVVVVEAVAPNRPGKVEFRGTNWTAVSDAALAAGAAAVVVRRDNLTLTVRPL